VPLLQSAGLVRVLSRPARLANDDNCSGLVCLILSTDWIDFSHGNRQPIL
jgi:hypothetical protein